VNLAGPAHASGRGTARPGGVTAPRPSAVARLSRAHRQRVLDEVFTESMGKVAGWCRARWQREELTREGRRR
jgi:hypothetical protein